MLLLTNGITDYSCIPLLMMHVMYTCREPRQSPTYEAYSRSRRYSPTFIGVSGWCSLHSFSILLSSHQGNFIGYCCHFPFTGRGPDHGPSLHRTQGVILVAVILMIFTEANQGLLKLNTLLNLGALEKQMNPGAKDCLHHDLLHLKLIC